MTEQLKQSLSAVIDGEADAFELRRVLDELDRDADLRATWSRYHLIGSVIRGERTARTGAVARALERRVPIAIRAGSSAANAADAFAPAGVSTGLASGSWRTFATRRAAIGFSAAVVVAAALGGLVGVGMQDGTREPAQVAEVRQPARTHDALPETLSLAEQQRARAYMLQHAQQQALDQRGVISLVKMATYEAP